MRVIEHMEDVLRLKGRLLNRIGPVGMAFIGSILLSLIAISGSITPNNDGMLYVEAAGLYQEQGLAAARQVFDWLFLPVLIATASSVTGLGLEAAAYLISALLLAGVCALIVACSRLQFPDTGWAACAVVLAMPAINAYRDYIIREFGAWFFIFLAFWLALRWARRPGWKEAVLAQLSIGVAALFRPEMLIFSGVLILWQLISVRQPDGGRRLAMIALVPALATVGLITALASGVLEIPGRLTDQTDRLYSALTMRQFGEVADRVATAALSKYSADEARSILFFGLVSIIPIKFLSNLGVFIVPLVYGLKQRGRGKLLRQWEPMAWGVVVYLVALMGFLFTKIFLTARYVSLLDLLVVPLVAVGLASLFRAMPRWRGFFLVLIAASLVSNMVTTSPKKTHYPAAANWLLQQKVDLQRVYIEEGEISYLTDTGYARRKNLSRQDLAKAVAKGLFDFALLRVSAKNQEAEIWAQANGLEVVERFYDGKGRGVLVLRARQVAHSAPNSAAR